LFTQRIRAAEVQRVIGNAPRWPDVKYVKPCSRRRFERLASAVRVPEALPVTSDEKGPLSVTRGSGGPPGERHGQYRHGERTKAVIAEQQKFSALLTMLRVGLT